MTSIDGEVIATRRYMAEQILANLEIDPAFNYSPEETKRRHENGMPNRQVGKMTRVMIELVWK
jgi:hypothetical protein